MLVIGMVKYLYLDTDYLDEEEAETEVEREQRKRERKKKKKQQQQKKNKKPPVSDDVIKLRCMRTLLGEIRIVLHG